MNIENILLKYEFVTNYFKFFLLHAHFKHWIILLSNKYF